MPAILCTLFCCVPFGIVSIIYAAQVNSKIDAGDTEGARDASGKAKTWCLAAFAVGLVVALIYIALNVVFLLARAGG